MKECFLRGATTTVTVINLEWRFGGLSTSKHRCKNHLDILEIYMEATIVQHRLQQYIISLLCPRQ